jgi:hypothetical protein
MRVSLRHALTNPLLAKLVFDASAWPARTERALISAQTACLGERRWSCVATRMRVTARVDADLVCAAIGRRQKC